MSKPNYDRDFRDCCMNVVMKYCEKSSWLIRNVQTQDLTISDKQKLVRFCSLAHYKFNSFELIGEGKHSEELTPMLQAFWADESKAREVLDLFTVNAFSAAENMITQQLEFALAEYRDSLGYVTDMQIERELDARDRAREMQAYL